MMSKKWRLSELGNLSAIAGRITEDKPLQKVTWFQVGGTADVEFQPASADDLAAFLKAIPNEVPVTVLGVGSNLLIRDGGLRGVVIRLSNKGFGSVEAVNATQLKAGAAATDRRVAKAAFEAGIGGFAFFHGIPGGIGGALRMNAGANGTEVKDRLIEVCALDRDGNSHTLSLEDMGYTYRHSAVSPDLIFTGALLEGKVEDKDIIQKEMDEVQYHRETVQPVKEKTGGSTFKNPEGQSAWRLVDDAGLRGHKIGDAQISQMHCNFMLNTDKCSAYDLESLGELARKRVYENSGVLLEWEIKRLGDFADGKAIETFKP